MSLAVRRESSASLGLSRPAGLGLLAFRILGLTTATPFALLHTEQGAVGVGAAFLVGPIHGRW